MTTEPTCNADDDGRPCHRNAVALRPVAQRNTRRTAVAHIEASQGQPATPPAVRNGSAAKARTTTVGIPLHGTPEQQRVLRHRVARHRNTRRTATPERGAT